MNVSRVHRLLRVITMLQSGRSYSARELADELEVSRRTIFRDLNMLELARIPYYYDADRGGYRIGRHFFLPPINLTLTEALAMLAMTGRLRGAKDVPLIGQAAMAAVKLENALPDSIRDHVGGMLDKLDVSLGPLADHGGVDGEFEALAHAVAGRNVCRLTYHSLHERKVIRTVVHPLKLAFIGRAWYVLAHSRMHRQVRTFKLSRISRLTVLPRTFAKRRDLDLDRHFGNAWSMIPEGREYKVRLRFSPKVANNVAEVRWHKTQRVKFDGDGSLDFRVTVDGLGEITWWILGYGDEVEVVSPAALRKRVSDVASAVAARYRKGGSPRARRRKGARS